MPLQEQHHPRVHPCAWKAAMHTRGSSAVAALYVHGVGFIALFSSLPHSTACGRTCREGCFMYNSFLGLCLRLQNRGKKACRALSAPLRSAGREEMAPSLCFVSTHRGEGK